MIFEELMVWVTIFAYALSAVGFIIGTFFAKPRAEKIAMYLAALGLLVHGAAIVQRWVRIGHGPFLGFYEVASLFAFVTVLAFMAIALKYPGLRLAGVVLMPGAFLILGGTLLVSSARQDVPVTLASAWLVVHVLFANLAFGTYAASFVLATAYLMKESDVRGRWESVLERFPAQDVLEELSFRMVGAGFVLQSIMIAAGAIWANEAWGRYWGWDPMETWSLIPWAAYAIYLHLTLTLGWRGRRAAWVAVFAMAAMIFSAMGVPIFYHSIHGAYLQT